MSINGKYEETLTSPGNGRLLVTSTSWEIEFYFPGPDARYNGTWLRIPGREVTGYIEAYRENWKEFNALKSQIPAGGSFRKEGKKGMSINIGSSGIYTNGVCIDQWHLPISKEIELNTLLNSFIYCIEKAPRIMEWLKNA